jgi:hypothetical protein
MAELLAGSTLGLLVGLLVGFSTEKLAGAVVAGLLALLAAFFGLRDIHTPARLTRISGFALVGTAALLFGVWLRTHDVLGANPVARREVWENVGFGREQAGRLAVFETLGLNLTGGTVATETPAGRGALFAAPLDECNALTANQFDTPEHRREAFALKPNWQKLAIALQGLDAGRQAAVMDAAWHLACETGSK